MQKNILIFFLITAAVPSLFSQHYTKGSPEWLVDMFFNGNNFLEKSDYYTGEMMGDAEQPTIGEELQNSGKQILFYKILAADYRETFAVELELEERVIDFYCFLKNENSTWKIEAIRRFLLPGFIYTVRDSISKLSSPSSADISLLRTLKLFTMNDGRLKNYLSSNVDRLSNLVWYFNQNENEEVDELLHALGCNAVYKDNRFAGCLFIQINSFERMEAGFIYATDSSTIPPITSAEYIYVEQVLPDWYIYRTM